MDAMDRQRKLFGAYLIDSFSESIQWQTFSIAEHAGNIQQSYDVDFLAFQCLGTRMAHLPCVSSLLSAGTSKIYSKCTLQKVKTNPPKDVFVFMRIGDYQVGATLIPLQSEVPNGHDGDDDHDAGCGGDVGIFSVNDVDDGRSRRATYHSTEPQHAEYLRAHINSKLAQRISKSKHDGTMTCRDALQFIEEHFANAMIAIFRYGQKQPLDEMKNLVKRLSGEGTVDLAMGTEIHVPGKFITGCYSSALKFNAKCYSNLGSKISCNYIVSGTGNADAVVKGSHRVVLYNTLQHSKRALNLGLCLKDQICSQNIIDGVSNAMEANMKRTTNLLLLQNALSASKLRLEMYIMMGPNEDLNISRDLLMECLRTKFPYVWGDVEEVRRKLTIEVKMLKLVFDSFCWWDGFSGISFLFGVYDNFSNCIYSKYLIDGEFLENSYGFCLGNQNFTLLQEGHPPLYMHEKHVMTNWHAMVNGIVRLFPKQEWAHVSLYCHLQIMHEFGHLLALSEKDGIFMSLSRNLVFEVFSKHVSVNHHNAKHVESDDVSMVPLLGFFDILLRSTSSKYLKLTLYSLIQYAKVGINVVHWLFDDIFSLALYLTPSRVYHYSKRCAFSSLQELLSFVENNPFYEIKGHCEEYLNGSSGKNEKAELMFILKEHIEREAFSMALGRCGTQHLLKPFRYPDMDVFLRFLYARAYVLNDPACGATSACLMEFFECISNFYFFLKLGLISAAFLHSPINAQFVKSKESFKRKILRLQNGHHYNFSQLLYFTGTFLTGGRVPNYSLACPQRCKVSAIIPMEKRPALIVNTAKQIMPLVRSMSRYDGDSISARVRFYENFINSNGPDGHGDDADEVEVEFEKGFSNDAQGQCIEENVHTKRVHIEEDERKSSGMYHD